LKVYKLFNDFILDQISFSEKDQIIPHLITPRSIEYSPSSEKTVDHCVSSGKYCGVVPNDLNITDGRLIVFEDLRQKCVYNLGSKANKKLLFFTYMVKFYDICIISTPARFNQECANSVLESLGLDTKAIQSCIEDSFSGLVILIADYQNYLLSSNTVLDAEFKEKNLYGLAVYPGIMINNRTFFVIIKVT